MCHSLAHIARRLCSSEVDRNYLAPLLACRLIALDKCPGVRPIGVCETHRRIIAKPILSVAKGDILEAAGTNQLCAGQTAGVEAAIHSVIDQFDKPGVEAVLLVDATNAFNSLNRNVALANIKHTCPILATVLSNIYDQPTELFCDGHTLWSQEGTTQGDPLAMPLYALATLPLIKRLPCPDTLHQVWYADDATATGTLQDLRQWWHSLTKDGPNYGYFPNSTKSWLVVKDEHEDEATRIFEGLNLNITTKGRPLLGAAIGCHSYVEQYVSEKVDIWCMELKNLTNYAETQPHAAYAAYIFGFLHKINFLSRTLSGIGHLLQPIDKIVTLEFIPKLTGRPPGFPIERDLLALPARHGGLGLRHLAHSSDHEFNASHQVTGPIVLNMDSKSEPYFEEIQAAQHLAKSSISRMKREDLSSKAEVIKVNLSPSLKLAMTLASEKGASSWLTTLPLVDFGLALHKGAFRDALCLRYGWKPRGIQTSCCCGSPFSVDHALSCPRGGFPTIRHNEVRDTLASWMSEICSGVTTEPHLQILTSESLVGATAIRGDEARLDIVADGLWGGRRERSYFDVRVVNPYARSNRLESLPALYRRHEKMKRRAYDQRVREV